MKKTGLMLATIMALTIPATAEAQLGGMLKKAVGLGEGDNSSAALGDPSQFLDNAFKATVNVMISADILANAMKNKDSGAINKDYVSGLMKAQNFKEIGAFKSQFESNMDALNQNKNLSQDLVAAHSAASAKQKQLISNALYNLALATFRNIKMAQQAPAFVRNVISDPRMFSRIGEFKTAGTLLGLQAKGLAQIAPTLPRVLSATKIKAPADSDATQPKDFDPASVST